MKFRVNWKYDTIIGLALLLLALFVWMGSKRIDGVKELEIQGYGGKLPREITNTLEKMNKEFEETRRVLFAQPDRIVIVDKDKNVKEYSFSYKTLWCNDFPVIGGVRAFHFEYRDEKGNLLTRANKNLSAIQRVTYIIRVLHGNKEVLTSSSVKLSGSSLDNNIKGNNYTGLITAYNY